MGTLAAASCDARQDAKEGTRLQRVVLYPSWHVLQRRGPRGCHHGQHQQDAAIHDLPMARHMDARLALFSCRDRPRRLSPRAASDEDRSRSVGDRDRPVRRRGAVGDRDRKPARERERVRRIPFGLRSAVARLSPSGRSGGAPGMRDQRGRRAPMPDGLCRLDPQVKSHRASHRDPGAPRRVRARRAGDRVRGVPQRRVVRGRGAHVPAWVRPQRVPRSAVQEFGVHRGVRRCREAKPRRPPRAICGDPRGNERRNRKNRKLRGVTRAQRLGSGIASSPLVHLPIQ